MPKDLVIVEEISCSERRVICGVIVLLRSDSRGRAGKEMHFRTAAFESIRKLTGDTAGAIGSLRKQDVAEH